MMSDRSPRSRGLYHNWVSYAGSLVAGAGLVLLLAVLGMRFSLAAASPYLGIVAFLVCPAIIFVGAAVYLFGMLRESRRRRRADEVLPYPLLDLNDRTQRRRLTWVLLAVAVGGTFLVYVAYNAFLFTESVTFCGRICHNVMQPEYVAYQVSPHASVRCVDCHTGPGASWYVRSKLSGVRQVFAVLFNTYDRPIQIPISDLRPARVTCEQCHWPDAFFGKRLVQRTVFDESPLNGAHQLTFALNTGGGRGPAASRGIHWHMAPSVSVTFVALDPELQTIPWFRVHRADGTTAEYFDQDMMLSQEAVTLLPQHEVDCMDCHNRPTHIIGDPRDEVDRALAAGRISLDLPSVKTAAVEALIKDYANQAAAAQGIEGSLLAYYRARDPQVVTSKEEEVRQASDVLLDIYQHNVFPLMKVGWRTYPNNIGHLKWPGCFRCHDGRHVTSSGEVLTRDCTACHTLPQRSAFGSSSVEIASLPAGAAVSSIDWHPWPLRGAHEEIRCDLCHSRLPGPPFSCLECHGLPRRRSAHAYAKLRSMSLGRRERGAAR